MSVSPRAADGIRKVLGYALAVLLTVLLFRILGRLAGGTQRLADLELWTFLGVGSLAVAWVRAAKRVRRSVPEEPPPPA